ncbi:hypothetical protein OSSY52_13720 [Tepiditoga spiralis]|uniref:HTH hxlR-type domain-containing protein n=1 Tax=Tepiditoga spiralis TaxID=2108365 RepID=A0A7G1G4E2_9BACT|nr:hypothetical protein [Tepiditoga spiralis]BBE31231.1 hypothetical protein OSSY52_13720 [Tepiditoga spiralis]
MYEITFGSELKIKILRILSKKGKVRFSEIKNSLKSGAGSTKASLDSLIKNNVVTAIEEGPRKKYFIISDYYKNILKELFDFEEKIENQKLKKDMLKNFFNIEE